MSSMKALDLGAKFARVDKQAGAEAIRAKNERQYRLCLVLLI